MNLRARLLIMGCLAIVLQVLMLFAVFSYVIDPNIIKLEKTLVEKNLHRGLGILQRELFHVEHLTQVLAQLPLIQQLVSTTTPQAMPSATLQEKMLQLEINLMYILNNNHDVIWEEIIDLNAEQPYPNQPFLTNIWEKKPKFLEHSTLLSRESGIYNSTLGPMLVVSTPISSPTKQQVKGTLIVGKLITQDMIHLIQSLSYTDVKLWPLGGSTLKPKQVDIIRYLMQSNSDFKIEQSGYLLRGYMLLQDLNQQPNLLISTTQSRDFIKSIAINLVEFGTILIFLQLLFIFLLYLLIYRTILVPIRQLKQHIEQGDEAWQRPPQSLKPWNEVDLLTNAISSLIARNHDRLVQETHFAYREGRAKMRDTIFQELFETLNPLIEGIELTEKKLSNLPVNDIEWIIAQSKAEKISPTQFAEFTKKLQIINDKLRLYRKETRHRLYELYSKALRNAAALRAQSRSLDPIRQLTSLSKTNRKKKHPMARS